MPNLSHNQEVLLTRQRHEADRAGLHYDVRMIVGDLAHSWATKKEMPEPGKAIILWEQPVHDKAYALSKKVVIPKGQYGAGVTTLDWIRKGQISNPEEDEHKFTLSTKNGDRFLFKKLPESYGKKAWLFKNLKAVEKKVPSEGTFTHEGVEYSLDSVLNQTKETPVEKIPVNKLNWVLKYDTPNPDRLKTADMSIPILVHNSNGREVAIDGLHRLTNAENSGMEHMSYKRVTDDMLNNARINNNPMMITNKYISQIEKKASLIAGAVGTHLAQNVATRAAMSSKGIGKYLANSFSQGAHGVVDTSLKAKAKRFITGAVVPDIAVAHKKAHEAGTAMKPLLDKATSRQKVGLRMLSQGRISDLKKYNLHKDEVVTQAHGMLSKHVKGIPSMDHILDNAKKVEKVFKDKSHPLVSNISANISRGAKPVGGQFKPGTMSAKSSIAGSLSSAIADPAGGALSTVKTLASSNTFNNTRYGNKLNKMMERQFVSKPIHSGVKDAKPENTFGKIKHKISGLFVNPVSAHLNRTSSAISSSIKS